MNIDSMVRLIKEQLSGAKIKELAIRLIKFTQCQNNILQEFRDDDLDYLRLFTLDTNTLKDYYFRFHEELTNRQFKQWGEWSTRKYGNYRDPVPVGCECSSCKNERDYYISRIDIMGRAFDLTVLVNCDNILEELENLITESKRLRSIHNKNLDGCLYRTA